MNGTDLPIVAGVDGSANSLAAAAYAATIAARRGVPLHLVHGYLHPWGYGALGLTPYTPIPDPRADATAMLRAAADTIRAAHPGLTVTSRDVADGGAYALVEASEHAGLIVVGRRGLGGFTELLLGSVSSQVAAHAHCPVIVLESEAVTTPSGAAKPILVGVDGSAGCVPAIELAFGEAAACGVLLVAVHVFWAAAADTPHHPADPEPDPVARRLAIRLVTDTLGPWMDKYPQVVAEPRLLYSVNPEHSLVEASRDASLIVVGSRGRGGFTGLLLGSVSQALVHHAHSPVAVAHPHRS